MTIEVGDQLPSGSFKTFQDGKPAEITTDEIFDGKTVVLFGVPGAFTPTCNDAHFPGFQVNADKIKEQGVDTIACMAVNDVFVMNAWGKQNDVGDDILMLADGNGDYAKKLGLLFDLSHVGMGERSRRFALVAKDGKIEYLGVEDGPSVTASAAESVLEHL